MWSLPETLRVTGHGLLVRVSMVLVTKLFLGNSGVGIDPPLNGHTNIHMYTKSPSYVSQDLECRVSSGPSALAGCRFGHSLRDLVVSVVKSSTKMAGALGNANCSYTWQNRNHLHLAV